MDLINFIEKYLENDGSRLMVLLCLILISSTLDFILGWVTAKFNKDVVFSTTIALLGIIKKIAYFILLVMAIPMFLIFPEPIGHGALLVLYTGFIVSEWQSILAHFNLAEDEKKNKLFLDFITRLLKGDNTK